MNYYFEFGDNVIGHRDPYIHIPAKYCVRYTPAERPNPPLKLCQFANRIWREDSTGNIQYIKNRLDTLADVDLKEFMWVKLSAHEV